MKVSAFSTSAAALLFASTASAQVTASAPSTAQFPPVPVSSVVSRFTSAVGAVPTASFAVPPGLTSGGVVPPAVTSAVQSFTSAVESFTSAVASAAPVPTAAAGAGTTHQVMVGGQGNKFYPETVNVNVGDSVVFMFATSTHNVIQSDAKGGCTKSTQPGTLQFPQAGGLAAQGTSFTYVVPQTNKNIWFYCAPHCDIGMVGGLLVAGANAAAGGNATASSTAAVPSTTATGAPNSAGNTVSGPVGVVAAVAGAVAAAVAF